MQAINSVNFTKKHFRITDFKAITQDYQDVIIQKDGIYSGYGGVQSSYSIDASRVERLYRVGNRFFAYLLDGSLCELSTSGIKNQLKTSMPPEVIEIIYQGEKRVLVAGKDMHILTDNVYEKVQDAPTCEQIIFHNGRLFTANNSSITYSGLFDMDNHTTIFSGGGSINLAISSGMVVGFFEQDNKLYVICQNAVYRLTAVGEGIDFKLEKLPVPSIEVESGTFCALFNACLFVSKGKIYSLKNAKVSCVCSLPKTFDGCQFYNAAAMQDVYLLGVEKENENFIYAYDYLSGAESIISVGCSAVAKDGYIIDKSNRIRRLDLLGSYFGILKYQSQPLNFDSLHKKTVFSVCAFVGSRCELVLSSDYGQVTLTLKKGYNRRKINLDGNEFTFTINNAGSGFCLSELRLDYANRGNYAI